jgi:hypothetical protein
LAASEKLLVSTTLANIASELRSIIIFSNVVDSTQPAAPAGSDGGIESGD